MNHFRPTVNVFTFLILVQLVATFCGCNKTEKTNLKTISSARQFDRICVKAKDRLLMLDFFDAGCMSCYMLAAQLEEIAKEYKEKVTIYIIDVAKNPGIAKTFNVTRRPYVVYVKNNKAVHAIAGMQPKETFVSAIEQFAD